MNFAVLSIVYNDERLIGGMLDGVSDLDKYVIISTPWHGEHKKFDRSHEIAKKMGATVIFKNFKSQKDARNYGLALLKKKGYDYVFVLDSDEYYLKSTISEIIKFVKETNADVYISTNEDKLFWKNEHWYFNHGGFDIVLRSDMHLVTLSAASHVNKEIVRFPDSLLMYHFSYSRSDEEILKKFTHNHSSRKINPDWYRDVWKRWTPEMENVHPTRPAIFKKAKYLDKLPEEIKNRYDGRY
jgi:hypothetical protein